jgi:peptidoglycan/LPS O-acetylase OafA/YrhL
MKPRESQTYFPQLDGIRTLAVLMVIVSHWYRGNNFPLLYYGGAMGVGLFFVLSGFLITHILLGQQPKFLEGNGETKKNILTTFYIRRTLRIFPIYYLYVAVLLLLGTGQVREIWVWLLTYTYNFQLFLTNTWHTGHVEHLWSLAIEEQYYLIWPGLLLFCPPRYHFHLVAGFILLAIGTKAFLYLQNPASQYSKFPVSQLDGFGFGSLLALFWQRGIRIPYAGWGLILCLGISFFLKWNRFHFHGMSFLGQVLPFYFAGCAFLIYMAARGMKGIPGFLLGNPVSVFLGKVSYGLYLYHLCIPALSRWVLDNSGISRQPEPLMWVLYCLLTLAITSLSWYLFEQPINRLKDRFTYGKKRES